jgi:hypothetical protein
MEKSPLSLKSVGFESEVKAKYWGGSTTEGEISSTYPKNL